ncbi:hypothetical protein [Arthrospiribacter ruber]|uniref:Lipocalin-like domain-containing protein n=1 Tax=Arthrospiribacter ruber TaxID=2487934 RepID=A0A951MD98_9BACT|nr:hypothetical protein [Arthrospiribacter ruber]MBW3467091.1 hypothetical protein [Arthrospiribacter ruber]
MMKRSSLLILFLALAFVACNQDNKEPEFNVLGYWNLIEIRSHVPADMGATEVDFEEKYIFNDDGTFIKTTQRSKKGDLLEIPLQAFGKYELLEVDELNTNIAQTFLLTFETNTHMAATCEQDFTEVVYITHDNKLFNMSWFACDGPGFVYSKRGRLF